MIDGSDIEFSGSEFTGERVIPGQVEPDLWAEHISRYRFSAAVAAKLSNPDALDIGCGTGYGTEVLAEASSSAVGIDVAPDALEYANAHYQRPNLRFVSGSATDLPFPDASFDLITAFEVIEHLADPAALLSQAHRVLRPGGMFLVSTPNKTYYAETRAKEGPNPYHLHEFTFDEFQGAIAAVFPSNAILLQNHTDAFSFHDSRNGQPADGFLETIAGAPTEAHFFLAVCSVQPVADVRNFVYVPAATNLLRTREYHISLLQTEVAQLKSIIDGIKTELATGLGERDAAIRHLEERDRQLEERTRWALNLDDDLRRTVADLKIAVDALHAAEDTVAERTGWGQSLEKQLKDSTDQLHIVRSARWLRFGRALGLAPSIDLPTRADSGKPDDKENA